VGLSTIFGSAYLVPDFEAEQNSSQANLLTHFVALPTLEQSPLPLIAAVSDSVSPAVQPWPIVADCSAVASDSDAGGWFAGSGRLGGSPVAGAPCPSGISGPGGAPCPPGALAVTNWLYLPVPRGSLVRLGRLISHRLFSRLAWFGPLDPPGLPGWLGLPI
jgi:hypothetical protein